MELEAINPVKLLIPDVWILIFERLHTNQYHTVSKSLTGNDLLSCSRVCVTFQNILDETKLLWLFQEILPLLAPYITDEPPSLLSLRATCTAWKLGVDHFIENYQYYFKLARGTGRLIAHPKVFSPKRKMLNFNRVLNSCSVGFVQLPICALKTNNKVCMFLEKMKDHPGSPFPGNTVFIYMCTQRDQQLWIVHLTDLLCRFGDYVRVLHIGLQIIPGSEYSSKNFKETVETSLLSMPNIQKLYVYAHGYPEPNGVNYEIENASSILQDVLFLPPHLESIEFDDTAVQYPGFPWSLQYSLGAPYFCQLKRLNFCFTEGYLGNTQMWEGCLPQLEELELSVQATGRFPNVKYWTGKSSTLRSIGIKLVDTAEELGPNRELNLTLYEILSRLQQGFGKQLDSLIITNVTSNATRATQLEMMLLCGFPNLKYLHIEGFDLLKVWIVEYLPRSLECLLVDGMEKVVFDSASCFMTYVSLDLPDPDGYYWSEVWAKLPHLKWLSVFDSEMGTRSLYYRENWEWNMAQKKKQRRGLLLLLALLLMFLILIIPAFYMVAIM